MKLYITVGYFIGALVGGGLLSAANVYLLGNFDVKVQSAIGAGLQLELLADILAAVVSSAILLIVLLGYRHQNQAPTAVLKSAAFGASQSILLFGVLVLLLVGPQRHTVLPAIAGWTIIVCWPVLAAFLLKGGRDAKGLR